MKTSRETLTILQDYYPERLGKFIVLTAVRVSAQPVFDLYVRPACL